MLNVNGPLSKDLFTSNSLLVYFNPSQKLTLMCDTSPYGVGAVLSQINEHDIERPVAYASRTLSQLSETTRN